MPSLTSAAANSTEEAPTRPYSLKRKASSTLSMLLSRLRRWNSAKEEDDEPEVPVSARSFSKQLQKLMRIIGLSNSDDQPQLDSDDQPQLGPAPAQPPTAVASLSQCSGISVDDITELSLEELVDKAFPPLSTPHPNPGPGPGPHPTLKPGPSPNLNPN